MLNWYLFVSFFIIASSKQIHPNTNLDLSKICKCVPYDACIDDDYLTNEELLERGIIVKCDDGMVCCNPSKISHKYAGPYKDCGIRYPEGLIPITHREALDFSNNSNAYFGEFPWMVAILDKKPQYFKRSQKLKLTKCGGSLIHPQVVLTAAHCVKKKHQYKIRAGEWDIRDTNEEWEHQDVDVRTVIRHPLYDSSLVINDFALLILEQPVRIDRHVDVVCLPGSDDVFDGKWCLATGWGKSIGKRKRKYQGVLKKVLLPIVNKKICEENMTKEIGIFTLHDSSICAGGEFGKDMCKGDGASPLVCRRNSYSFVQAGLVSWGNGCGKENVPGIYGNIANARNWIDEQIIANFILKTNN